jgi:hypothetical protein
MVFYAFLFQTRSIERFSENVGRPWVAANFPHQVGQLIEMPYAQHNDGNICGRWRGA